MQASDYLGVIRARKWLVMWVAAVATVGAVGVSMFQPAMYGAEAVLLYLQSNTGTAILGTPQSNAYESSDVEIATQVGLIEQPSIAQKVIDELGLHVTAAGLLKQLTISGDGQTKMITIAAVDRTPAGSAAIANAMANAYSQRSQEVNRRSITAAAEETRRGGVQAEFVDRLLRDRWLLDEPDLGRDLDVRGLVSVRLGRTENRRSRVALQVQEHCCRAVHRRLEQAYDYGAHGGDGRDPDDEPLACPDDAQVVAS